MLIEKWIKKEKNKSNLEVEQTGVNTIFKGRNNLLLTITCSREYSSDSFIVLFIECT